MNTFQPSRAALLTASLVALPAACAATMAKADHKPGPTCISGDHNSDKAARSSKTANIHDICIEEAKAKEKGTRSEHGYNCAGQAADRSKVRVAKAESAYVVAKDRSDDQAGNAKEVGVKEVKAKELKALADAKMIKEIGEEKEKRRHRQARCRPQGGE